MSVKTPAPSPNSRLRMLLSFAIVVSAGGYGVWIYATSRSLGEMLIGIATAALMTGVVDYNAENKLKFAGISIAGGAVFIAAIILLPAVGETMRMPDINLADTQFTPVNPRTFEPVDLKINGDPIGSRRVGPANLIPRLDPSDNSNIVISAVEASSKREIPIGTISSNDTLTELHWMTGVTFSLVAGNTIVRFEQTTKVPIGRGTLHIRGKGMDAWPSETADQDLFWASWLSVTYVSDDGSEQSKATHVILGRHESGIASFEVWFKVQRTPRKGDPFPQTMSATRAAILWLEEPFILIAMNRIGRSNDITLAVYRVDKGKDILQGFIQESVGDMPLNEWPDGD